MADIDNDGDMDIVSGSAGDNTIAWYENDGASDPSWSAVDIATNAQGVRCVFVADIDNDGDMDIVSANYGNDKVVWYENNNGDGSSWSAANIDTGVNNPQGVFVADIDNDGDMDVVSASAGDDMIAWYENDNGDGSSWTGAQIDDDALAARSVFAADMDNDGDMDIVSASQNDNTIAWYENNNGDGSSWSAENIATNANGAKNVFVADMDNDGDLDIVSASSGDNTIAWYENDGAPDPSWSAVDIAISADGAYSVFVADMDNDGDMDIVSASQDDDTIAWYENNAGIPEFSNIMMPIVSVLAIVGLNYRSSH